MDRAGRSSDMLGQYHLLQVFFWVVLDAQQFTWLQQPQLLTLQINQTFTKVHAYLDGIIHVHGCLSENPHVWWLNIQLLIVNCPCLMAISSQFMVKSRYLKAHPNVDSYIPILYEKQRLFWCREIIEQNPNDYDATNLFDVFFSHLLMLKSTFLWKLWWAMFMINHFIMRQPNDYVFFSWKDPWIFPHLLHSLPYLLHRPCLCRGLCGSWHLGRIFGSWVNNHPQRIIMKWLTGA